MRTLKILAAVAIATTTIASSAMARDGYHRRGYGGPGAAVAAGIAGAAIGAGIAASSPYRDSYAYYGDEGYGPGYVTPGYGYSRGYGSTYNSNAGAGGYNTNLGSPTYQSW